MISKISTSPSCDAYYELPEGKYEYEEQNAVDFDSGEYILEIQKPKDSIELENQSPERRKPGHRPTLPGIYDDLYDYDTGTQTSEVNPENNSLKDKDVCSNQSKTFVVFSFCCCFVVTIIGICVIGAISVGMIFHLQGT